MTKRLRSTLLLVALLTLVVFAPERPLGGVREEPAAEVRLEALDAIWWARAEPFLRRVLNIPRKVELELKEIKSAAAPDFCIVTIEVHTGAPGLSRQGKPFFFYASADGTKILLDQLYDLTQDPFANNRARIQLERVPSLGPADAGVTIVEYSDYTCPWCQRFFLTAEKPLLARYAGQVRYVYKHFPLVGLRAWSENTALAAACAFRQSNDAFWVLHEQLFIHMRRLGEGKDFLYSLVNHVPLDAEEFAQCYEGREALADVNRDIAEGESLGVQGTPTFFINGRPMHGLPSTERFWEIVEEELALANTAKKE